MSECTLADKQKKCTDGLEHDWRKVGRVGLDKFNEFCPDIDPRGYTMAELRNKFDFRGLYSDESSWSFSMFRCTKCGLYSPLPKEIKSVRKEKGSERKEGLTKSYMARGSYRPRRYDDGCDEENKK